MRHYIPVISVPAHDKASDKGGDKSSDVEDRAPEFLRIARAIMSDIERGRLRPSAPLPGTRELASALGVHRNTVIAAFRELVAQGWLTTEPARGTFVSKSLPEVRPRASSRAARSKMADRVGFDLRAPAIAPLEPAMKKGTLSLSGGIPDVRLVPTSDIARAIRRAMKATANLGYGMPAGVLSLREELARMLSASRGVSVTADALVVTRGSQMALDLLARAIIAPGDVVCVESLGYKPAWDVFRLAGARLVPIPVDAHGLNVAALERVLKEERVRAVYLTPHHQYPTTVTLPPGRRLALLLLAKTSRFAIIEDDYDHEFHYEGRPVLPLASADDAGVVLYVGTLSKVLAPGFRIGYIAAPPKFCELLSALRKTVDRQGDHVVEAAIAELLDDGTLERHVRRARRVYLARRDHFANELQKKLKSILSYTIPLGGTAVWATVTDDIDVRAWTLRAHDRGILLQDASRFTFDGRPKNALRLGFAQLDERELTTAVDRMVSSLKK